VVVGEARWDKGGSEPVDSCSMEIVMVISFFVHKGIITIKRVEFISERM
jgi:hypothetical protein